MTFRNRLSEATFVVVAAFTLLAQPAQAYFEPTFVTYLIQSLAAMAFFFVIGFRRIKQHVLLAMPRIGGKTNTSRIAAEEESSDEESSK
jgi:hypothetical protein